MRKPIIWQDSAKKDLRAIEKVMAMHILRGLDLLSLTGEGDVKRLQDLDPPEYRLRIGSYRVRFYDYPDSIQILAVKHRREAYRKA